jgi:hypothetical protein
MARTNRRDVLVDGEIQVVHCINRCVRRAYLCGQDPLTGTDYEHRRELIRQRMEFLAGIMGIEVLGYSVMSNHFHCILRSGHDVVATWSDDEIARKWWMLCPARKDKDGNPAEPTEFELNSIRDDKTGLKVHSFIFPCQVSQPLVELQLHSLQQPQIIFDHPQAVLVDRVFAA